MSIGDIRDYLGVDSLAYLDLGRLVAATGAPDSSFCTACFSGDYPVPIREAITSDAAEVEVSFDENPLGRFAR